MGWLRAVDILEAFQRFAGGRWWRSPRAVLAG
jgi:hypothetical protein